jgi:transposase-like protein
MPRLSDLNKKIYETIETWRNRPIEGEHPYVYLDGIVMKRSWAGEVRNVSLLVAIAVNAEGYREILGICEGAKEDKAGWSGFLKHLKERGLTGVRLIISEACLGLAESAADYFPDALWQRCVVREVAAMLKAIHASEDVAAAREKASQVVAKLRALRLTKAAELVETGVGETLAYYEFPEAHWRRIRTTDVFDKPLRPQSMLFLSCSGDRVAMSRAEVGSPVAQPMIVAPLLRRSGALMVGVLAKPKQNAGSWLPRARATLALCRAPS